MPCYSFYFPQGVTEGYNGTIFAYGQTGSGKSFTMQGVSEPAAQRGVIPRAFEHVFESIQVIKATVVSHFMKKKMNCFLCWCNLHASFAVHALDESFTCVYVFVQASVQKIPNSW